MHSLLLRKMALYVELHCVWGWVCGGVGVCGGWVCGGVCGCGCVCFVQADIHQTSNAGISNHMNSHTNYMMIHNFNIFVADL